MPLPRSASELLSFSPMPVNSNRTGSFSCSPAQLFGVLPICLGFACLGFLSESCALARVANVLQSLLSAFTRSIPAAARALAGFAAVAAIELEVV